MLMKKTTWLLIVLCLGTTFESMCGFVFPLNLYPARDVILRPEPWPGKKFQFTVVAEIPTKVRAHRGEDVDEGLHQTQCDKDDVLQLWHDKQNALAMLKGFCPESPQALLGQQLNIDDDDGIRGHFVPRSDFDIKANVIFAGRYYFPYNLVFAAYLPLISMELDDVCWSECTRMVKAEDFLTKELLTNDFCDNVKRLGCDLDLKGWKRTAVGDLVTELSWMRFFYQRRPMIEGVRLNGRFGLIWPTGRQKNEDKMFSIPFGTDGSFGLYVALGLDLYFGKYLRGGVDAEFTHIFDNEKCRRIKIDSSQTDLLFLFKTPTVKEFGFMQRFNLYLEGYMTHGASARVTYQYTKKDSDMVVPLCECSSVHIANMAESLQEWTLHNFVFSLTYNMYPDFHDMRAGSYFQLLYKIGFNGKRSVLANTVGIGYTVSF